MRAVFLSVILAVMVATPVGAQPKPTKVWWAGGWKVSSYAAGAGTTYDLVAFGSPDRTPSPAVELSCSGGRFSIGLIGAHEHLDGLYHVEFTTDRGAKFPMAVSNPSEGALPVVVISLQADGAEYALSNATRVAVTFRRLNSADLTLQYRFTDLARGKPQLFKVCRPATG